MKRRQRGQPARRPPEDVLLDDICDTMGRDNILEARKTTVYGPQQDQVRRALTELRDAPLHDLPFDAAHDHRDHKGFSAPRRNAQGMQVRFRQGNPMLSADHMAPAIRKGSAAWHRERVRKNTHDPNHRKAPQHHGHARGHRQDRDRDGDVDMG